MLTMVGWLHLGVIAAGVGGTLFLLRWVWDLRDRPGAWWFLGVFLIQFALLSGYGLGYVIFDPQFRYGIEVLGWIAAIWLGTLYLAFALGYTGRTNWLTPRRYGPVVGFACATTVAILTDPLHGLLISEFAVEAVTGLRRRPSLATMQSRSRFVTTDPGFQIMSLERSNARQKPRLSTAAASGCGSSDGA